MKSVLIVTYDFPPPGDVGGQRAAKFAKYLVKQGWNVSVLTKRPSRYSRADPGLSADVAGVTLHQIPALSLFETALVFRPAIKKERSTEGLSPTPSGKRVSPWDPRAWLIPDGKILWALRGFLWARNLPLPARSAIVVSTIPTPSAAVLGRLISDAWNVPHVVDFRDPWMDASFLPKRLAPLARLERSLQRHILMTASSAIVVHEKERREVQRIAGDLSPPIWRILNGYDEADFANTEAIRVEGGFVIAHVGALYDRGEVSTDLNALVEALQVLAIHGTSAVKDIHFVQVGTLDRRMKGNLERMAGVVRVSMVPPVPHREAIGYMLGADVLYLPTFDNILRAKTFEYVRAGPPILAVGNHIESTRVVLAEFCRGMAFKTSDAVGISNFLNDVRSGNWTCPSLDMECLREYSRETKARQLGGVLENVLRLPQDATSPKGV